jgi:HEAT repeat protein
MRLLGLVALICGTAGGNPMRPSLLLLFLAVMVLSCGDEVTPKAPSDGDDGGKKKIGEVKALDVPEESSDPVEKPPPPKPPADPEAERYETVALLMKSSDYEERAQAVVHLREAKDRQKAGKMLMELLYDEDEDVRELAAEALGHVKYSGGVDGLRALLGKEKESSVRKAAVQSLYVLGGKSVVEDLVNVLKNDLEESVVKALAAQLLGDAGTEKAADALVVALEDFDENVRLAAVTAITELKPARALDTVIEMLEDANGLVRTQAALACGELGDKKAVPALIRMLDPSEGMQALENATKSLCKLTGEKKGMQYSQEADSDEKEAVLKAWETWWEEHRDEWD